MCINEVKYLQIGVSVFPLDVLHMVPLLELVGPAIK